MLIVESLQAIAKSSKLYPNEDETKEILKIDGEDLDLEARQTKLNEDFEKLLEMAKAQGLENMIQRKPNEISFPVAHKDRTFHFLPYKFDSNLEKEIFTEALRDEYLKSCRLEIYFNGEKDITDFRILCYTEKNKYVGRCTPDFMIV